MHKSLDEFKFRPDTTTDRRVICPCASEKLMNNVVNALAPSFLIGSSSFLQVTMTTVKYWISSKFGQIQPCTAELAALDRLKKSLTYLRTIQNILMMTSWLPGERSLSFGLLVLVRFGLLSGHLLGNSCSFG